MLSVVQPLSRRTATGPALITLDQSLLLLTFFLSIPTLISTIRLTFYGDKVYALSGWGLSISPGDQCTLLIEPVYGVIMESPMLDGQGSKLFGDDEYKTISFCETRGQSRVSSTSEGEDGSAFWGYQAMASRWNHHWAY